MSGKNRYFMSDAGNEGLGSTATTTERIVPEVTEVFTVKLDGKKFSRIKPKFDRGQSKSWRTKGGPKPDRFPGKAPLDPVAVMRHSRGDGVKAARVKTKYGQKMAKRREELAKATEETAARTEFLLQEDAGYLVADDPEVDVEEFTGRISQESIRRSLVQQNQSASAEMGFELSLKQFGPYVTDYSRNGRSLLLGGRKGHIAALDWQQKKLKCEINVQDAVRDVKWLHTDSMFAVAQNRWTHIYDSQGIELHCLKKIDSVLKMEFLPYHFLLVTGSERGFLTWLDISVGEIVAQFGSRLGPLPVLCQNPANAVICCGHSKGTVTMWTPSVRGEPVMKILAHRQAVTAVAVDRSGTHMATAAMDKSVRIWDLRNTGGSGGSGAKCLAEFNLSSGSASCLQFSDRKILGASIRPSESVEFFKDVCTVSSSSQSVQYPYMVHKVHRRITDFNFVPFEDVVGIGHADGFSSILVPGCGEPNFDSFEANPFQTKKQRKESEVKALLEKIPADLIALDENQIAQVDTEALQETLAARNQMRSLKPSQIDFEPRTKSRGRGGTVKKYHIRRTVKEEERRRRIKELASAKDLESREGKQRKLREEPKSVLSRLA